MALREEMVKTAHQFLMDDKIRFSNPAAIQFLSNAKGMTDEEIMEATRRVEPNSSDDADPGSAPSCTGSLVGVATGNADESTAVEDEHPPPRVDGVAPDTSDEATADEEKQPPHGVHFPYGNGNIPLPGDEARHFPIQQASYATPVSPISHRWYPSASGRSEHPGPLPWLSWMLGGLSASVAAMLSFGSGFGSGTHLRPNSDCFGGGPVLPAGNADRTFGNGNPQQNNWTAIDEPEIAAGSDKCETRSDKEGHAVEDIFSLVRLHVQEVTESAEVFAGALRIQQENHDAFLKDIEKLLQQIPQAQRGPTSRHPYQVELSASTLRALADLMTRFPQLNGESTPQKNATINAPSSQISVQADAGLSLRGVFDAIDRCLQQLVLESSTKQEATRSFNTLAMLLQNYINNPASDRHRKVNASGSRFSQLLGGGTTAGADLLKLAGFRYVEPNFFKGNGDESTEEAQRVLDLLKDAQMNLGQLWTNHSSPTQAPVMSQAVAAHPGSADQVAVICPVTVTTAGEETPISSPREEPQSGG